jgi:hypothetical protein
MWLNSVSLGRFEVAGWGGCGGCGDGWASLMKVQAMDVCGNDSGDAGLCMCTQQFRVLTDWFNKITEKQKINQLDMDIRAGYDSTLLFFPML